MFSRFDRIPACDGQTDGQTYIFRRHSPRYALHRAVKTQIEQFNQSINQKRIKVTKVTNVTARPLQL